MWGWWGGEVISGLIGVQVSYERLSYTKGRIQFRQQNLLGR